MNDERFIDVDNAPERRMGEAESYENIVVRQIGECVKILSKGIFSINVSKNNSGSGASVVDMREEVINNVDTLRMLMSPFLKIECKAQVAMDKFSGEFGERLIIENGKKIAIKDSINFNPEAPIWAELTNFKVRKSRELFEELVKAYNQNKDEIARLSIDE